MDREPVFVGEERMQDMQEVHVLKIAENGLGYGEGSISNAERTDVTPEIVAKADEAIESREILVRVDTDNEGNMLDDDGCGDGRGVIEVWEGAVQRLKSLNRAKVFGGAAAMAAAARIGLGKAKGSSLVQTFKSGISTLKEKMIGFGAHTDTHAHGPNCGCGAIDKAPQSVANAVKYEAQIRGTIDALGVDTDGLDDVFDNFREYAGEIAGQDYAGKDVKDEIVKDGKVVKKLDGEHKEYYILLNMVRGYTVNQELVREVTGGKLQAFGVDVWRMQDLAERMHPGDEAAQKRAFLSELVYTLGVAATLTKGDQPVRVLTDENFAQAA